MVHPHQTEVCIRRVQVQIPQFPLRERRYVTSIHCVVSLSVRSQPDRFDTVEGLPSRSAILKGRRLTLPPCNRPPYIPMSPDLLRRMKQREALSSSCLPSALLCPRCHRTARGCHRYRVFFSYTDETTTAAPPPCRVLHASLML
jgi:hypothetical protein